MTSMKLHMESKKLSQAEAAAQIGITTRSLYSYMQGERIPRPSIAKKIFNWSGGEVTANDHHIAYEAFHGKV